MIQPTSKCKCFALLLTVSALSTWSCKPQEILTEKVIIRETQTVHDTLKLRDTLRLENERVQVELIKLPGEKVFLKGTCKGDTVQVVTNNVIKEVTPKQKRKEEWVIMSVIAFLALALLGVIWRR